VRQEELRIAVAQMRHSLAVAVDVHHEVVRHPEQPAAVVLVPELRRLSAIVCSLRCRISRTNTS
jgi:hypothetical protein